MPLAPASPAPAEAVDWPKPPVRLRLLVLVAFVGGLSFWLYPRAVAAWQVHELASALADYGACMVGPTGPSLLRGSSLAEFERLTRRRLLAAAPNEAPFARCAPLARKLTGSADVEGVHAAQASRFQEYGTSSGATPLSLTALRVGPEVVMSRARLAWPFVRQGYTSLVQTTLEAKEAMHPVAPPRPATGRGLPGARSLYRSALNLKDGMWLAYGRGARFGAYKSVDGGLTWKAWPTTAVENIAERCAIDAEGRGFAFGATQDGSTTTVLSLSPGRDAAVTPLTSSTQSVVASACDAQSLVVLSKPREGAQELWLCDFEKRCGKLNPPALPGVASALDYPADVARVAGATVVAVTMNDVVRVASSRDNGKSWTPFTVAYDDAEYPDLRVQTRVPNRLLVVGKRLFLYGAAAKSTHSYSLLYSDDQGASFRGASAGPAPAQ